MAEDPNWADIFSPKEDEPPAQAVQPPVQPASDSSPPPAAEQPHSWPLTAATPSQHLPAEQPPPAGPPVPGIAAPDDLDPAAGSPQDPFAAMFARPASAPVPVSSGAPMTRRELREQEAARGRRGRGSAGGSGSGGSGPRKRGMLWLKITLPLVLVLGVVGGASAFAWFNYNDQVRELLGIPLPTDYEGTGNGEEVVVTIRSGDIGSDVANTLHKAGVTMTFDAVYDYLVEHPEIGFTPGNWSLQREMSAASAVAALQEEANKLTSSLLIIEGLVLPDVIEIIAATTGLPLEEVQAATADPTAYEVVGAPSLEGYLFPATYQLEGGETASQILQMLVDETFSRLDSLGVPVERRHEILTMAGLIQREAGSNPDDFFKVSRVFWNRIEQGMLLQSDATVAYGTGNLHTVWTTDSERADPGNPYNTYVHPGLPVGPIGAPGELAMQAALQPAEGPWLYFVPINLETGETVFSETVDEHEAAVELLHEWCEESAENASYCE